MKYTARNLKTYKGVKLILRSPRKQEAEDLMNYGLAVHGETHYLIQDAIEFSENNSVVTEKAWIKECNKGSTSMLIGAYTTSEYKLVGLVDFAQGEYKANKHIVFIGISVLKEYANQGIGSLLLESAIEVIRKMPNVRFIQLAVAGDNDKALSLYEHYGFTEVARIPQAYLFHRNFIDKVIMTKQVG